MIPLVPERRSNLQSVDPTPNNPISPSRRRFLERCSIGGIIATIAWMGYEAYAKFQRVARKTDRDCVLKQLGLALLNYADSTGKGAFPPAYLAAPDGTPLLSWRVLIIPFISQESLFNQFNLNEPWDSDHNYALLPRMPMTYASCRNHPASKEFKTYFRVFDGHGAAFEGSTGISMKDFTDGTSNTILVADAGEAVYWTKPEELAYGKDIPLPSMGGFLLKEDFFQVVMADGSTRAIPKLIDEKQFRAAILRKDGIGLTWGDVDH